MSRAGEPGEEAEDSGTDIEIDVQEDTCNMESIKVPKPTGRSKSRSPIKKIKQFFRGSSPKGGKGQEKTAKYLKGVDTSRYYQVSHDFGRISGYR